MDAIGQDGTSRGPALPVPPAEAGGVAVGVDPGQRRDPTALAVVQAEWRPRPDADGFYRGETEAHAVVRHLERLPLGTTYPDVARRVAAVCAGVVERTFAEPVLYIDATGVGTPVVDVLREADVPARLVAVYFTHGDRRTLADGSGGREVRLGKAWLVSRLQALLQTGRLHLPRTAEAARLATELQDYEIKIDRNANDTYGAFKTGAHDDLTTALGLACQDLGETPLPAILREAIRGASFYAGPTGSLGAGDWSDAADEALFARLRRRR
jgi:hypothetical protein